MVSEQEWRRVSQQLQPRSVLIISAPLQSKNIETGIKFESRPTKKAGQWYPNPWGGQEPEARVADFKLQRDPNLGTG